MIIMQFLSAEGSARIGEEIDTMEMAIGFQRIAMQKTKEMEVQSGLFLCDGVILPHEETQETSTHKAGVKMGHHTRSPSRQPAREMREIPLLKIPAALQCGIKANGGKIFRIGIVRSHVDDYTIKIRCNTRKEAEHYDQSRNTDLTNTTGSFKFGDGP